LELIDINNKRRSSLKAASELLERAYTVITQAREDEEDAIDNMPDNLQNSERYELMEETASLLSDAEECIDTAISKISDACQK